MSGRNLACAVLLAVVCAPAIAAEPVRDEATGLSIAPPAGYVATRAESDARYAAVYAVQKKDEVDTGCKVAFQPAVANPEQPLSQDDINRFTRQKEWTDLIRATLALRYNVASVEAFDHQGLMGAQVVADFKPIEGEPKTEDVRSYLVVVDTPKGRTTIVCVGDKKTFEGRRKEFEAVARSVSPPR